MPSHTKENTIKQLLHIQPALDCSPGTIRLNQSASDKCLTCSHCRSHLPQLFIGMEHIQLSNMQLAESHLAASVALCDSDPILFNELGVVAYENRK